MTGNEEEAQQVVANIVVESGIEVWHGQLFRSKLTAQFLVLALKPGASAEGINGAMLGGGHEPGAGVVRYAGLGPLLKGRDQGVLREIFGEADIAHDSREAGDETWRFDPPDRVDGAMKLGAIKHGAIDAGRHHRYRSHHLSGGQRKRGRRLCRMFPTD